MQAITTKYFGPTGTKGSRIKAHCNAGSVTIPYPHELSGEDVHKAAALALVKKLGWDDPHYGQLIGGGTDSGYVFVFESRAISALRKALGNLCQHVQGNRGSRSGNPYSVPEMKDALKALYFDKTGIETDEYQVYCDASDPYKKEQIK